MNPCIKLFTGLGALILLIIGLGFCAFSAYGWINPSIFVGDEQTRNLTLGIFVAVGVSIIGASANGLYGICAEKPKMLCCFQLFVVLFLLIFLGLGIALAVLPGVFFEGSCSTSTNSVIVDANNLYNASFMNYCKNDQKTGCVCALNTTTEHLQGKGYDQDDIAYIQATYKVDKDGSHNTENCVDGDVTPAEKALYLTMGELEKFLKCSLWCPEYDHNLIYRFRDIDSGKPENYCYDRLKKFFEDYSYWGMIGAFAGSGIMLLMFACNLYICCSPERRKRGFRERFMYISEDEDYGRYRKH